MSNEHAERLLEQASEVEALDIVEAARVGATMRNAAAEIDRLTAELDEQWKKLFDLIKNLASQAK